MKALKTLVIFMTLLLVAGLALLGYGLATKTHKPAAAPRLAGPAPSEGFGTVAVPLPAGARLDQVMVAGDRVVLRVTGGGDERLVVLDPSTGAVAGSFVLAPSAPVGK